MIGLLIIACEIGFWAFILAGLFTRYILKMPRLSAILLICTPLTDLVLLTATVIDLHNGAEANLYHGLAAIYLGVSVVYGKKMVRWADRQFEYRFAGGEKPVKRAVYGAERAREERIGWYQHALAWLIGCAILAAMILMVDGVHGVTEFIRQISHSSTAPLKELFPATYTLYRTVMVWSLILAIDFLISFSYTVFPKEAPKLADHKDME